VCLALSVFSSQGELEEIVGQAFKGRRDDVVLATNFALPMGSDVIELVGELSLRSKRFRTLWASHDVRQKTSGPHPSRAFDASTCCADREQRGHVRLAGRLVGLWDDIGPSRTR
jgi:hypothetical protein